MPCYVHPHHLVKPYRKERKDSMFSPYQSCLAKMSQMSLMIWQSGQDLNFSCFNRLIQKPHCQKRLYLSFRIATAPLVDGCPSGDTYLSERCVLRLNFVTFQWVPLQCQTNHIVMTEVQHSHIVVDSFSMKSSKKSFDAEISQKTLERQLFGCILLPHNLKSCYTS